VKKRIRSLLGERTMNQAEKEESRRGGRKYLRKGKVPIRAKGKNT